MKNVWIVMNKTFSLRPKNFRDYVLTGRNGFYQEFSSCFSCLSDVAFLNFEALAKKLAKSGPSERLNSIALFNVWNVLFTFRSFLQRNVFRQLPDSESLQISLNLPNPFTLENLKEGFGRELRLFEASCRGMLSFLLVRRSFLELRSFHPSSNIQK